MNRKSFLTSFWGLLLPLIAIAQVNMTFNLGLRGPLIDDHFYGIFFEELSHSGEGGLYAELIQNRSFEDNGSTAAHWYAVGGAQMRLTSDNMMNSVQQHALLVETTGAGQGVRNEGFWGISTVAGTTYKLSFWIRTDENWQGTVTARLVDNRRAEIGQTEITVDASTTWKQYTAEVTATSTDASGCFDLIFGSEVKATIDMVSLFPPTFNDRENGMRKDIGQMLANIKPKFLRFPGGCYVEGVWSQDLNSECRYLWKNSVGPQEERIPLWNNRWGYMVSNGQGIYEYLQYCEDIGATPMYVANIGVGHDWVHDYQDIGEYIQETLDLIEYCNGDVTTEWGSKRAAAGHPEPFNLKYIEIGNENYTFDHYADRYIQFYNAIKAKYPEIVCIGNLVSWGSDYPRWTLKHPVDLIDEHYYRSPGWFMSSYNRYDNYSRTEPKVYVGEWAASEGKGNLGNMNAALGEAIFMCGAENNSDIVRMLSFSEPIANISDVQWPAMIYHNSSMAVGTPSYYAQVMYGSNIGSQNVKWKEEGNLSSLRSLGVATWSTSSEFWDIKVTDLDGNVIFDAATTTADDWTNEAGQWGVENGVLKNATTAGTRSTYTLRKALNTENIIYTMKARKLSGAEGFLIPFDFKDESNYTWWAIGGWGNTTHGIEQNIDGVKSVLASTGGNVSVGREYDIKIVKEGLHVKCYLDGEIVHDFYMQDPQRRLLYVSSNINDETGELFVKVVNPHSEKYDAHLTFENGRAVEGNALVMNSNAGTDENSFVNPQNIVPHEETVTVNADGTIDYMAKPFSINILRLKVTDVSFVSLVEEIALQLEEARAIKKEKLTTVLWNNLQDAVDAAAGISDGTPYAEQEQALKTLKEAVVMAKSIDVTMLRNTVELAEEEGCDVDAAKSFLESGTTSSVLNEQLEIVRDARKLNAADKQADVFSGSDPIVGGKYYLYNIGAQRYLAGGSEFGTHAAVSFAAQIATIEAAGDGYKIRTHIRNGLEYLGDVGGTTTYLGGTRTYVDTNGSVWYFTKLGNGAYTISTAKTNDGATLLGFAGNDWWTVEDNCQGADNPNNQWRFVTKEERDALFETASAEHPVDATYYIHAAGFDRHLFDASLAFPTQRWSASANGGSYGLTGWGTWYCDLNYETFNSGEFTLSQTLTGLKPGIYRMGAQGFYRHNQQLASEVAEYQSGTLKSDIAILYAVNGAQETRQTYIGPLVSEEAANKVPGIGVKTEVGYLPDNRGFPGTNEQIDYSVTDEWGAAYYFETGLYKLSVDDIVVGEDGKLTIGFKKFDNNFANEWVCVDNFRLWYLGPNNKDGISGPFLTSPREGGDKAVYDLQGRKVADNPSSLISNPSSQKGIYIVNGAKIVVK